MSQLIISIGREYGSGGHEIAVKLSEHFDLPLYDHNIMREIAKERNISYEDIKKYDEKPAQRLLSRTVQGLSSSPQDNIAYMQFDYLKRLAKEGKSFIVVGRCSDAVLKECTPNLISIFVLGDKDAKIKRISELHGINESEAKEKIRQHDKYRKAYHNSHCEGKWGDSRSYDLTINSSRMSMDDTVKTLISYIDARSKNFE